MINHELLPDERMLLVTPEGRPQSRDFQMLAREVDPYTEEGAQNGSE